MQSHPLDSDDLNAFVDGELAAERREEIARALRGDTLLTQEVHELQATALLLSHLPEFTPRRSFALGAEFAKPKPVPPPTGIVRLLPVVRALSVAAILVFIVVGGALFFDINGQTTNGTNGTNETFQQQNEIMNKSGVTNTDPETSDHQEDAANTRNADGSSMTSRGDAAAVGDAPMEDLTGLSQEIDHTSGDTSDQVAQAPAPGTTAFGSAVDTGDSDHTSWIWTSVVLAALATILAGLWFALSHAGQPAENRRSHS